METAASFEVRNAPSSYPTSYLRRFPFQQAVTWPTNVKVAVNLSPVQFKSPNLLQAGMNIRSILIRSSMRSQAPACLQPPRAEITESVLLDESGTTLSRSQPWYGNHG
jgi:EAL domain-containing protein (putative c-di-GMP-specific phosphodiesterase class I)